MLTLNDGRAELWQWDTGRTLAVDADCSQVHFSNKVFGRSIDVDVVDGVAIIPDVLLQTDKDLNVWAFVGTAENGYTKISKTFTVNRRNKPADYVFTPPDQTSLEEIKEKLEYLESMQDPGAIKNAVEDYLEQNPVEAPVKSVNGQTGTVELTAKDVGAISQDDLQEATNKALAQAKESGEFDGKDGAPGVDGHTPEYGVDYGKPEQITEIAQYAADILQPEVDKIKSDLSNKLPKSPADWEAWTAEEQSAARKRMGIGDYELIEEITIDTDDITSIIRDTDPNGNPYSFAKIWIICECPKQSQNVSVSFGNGTHIAAIVDIANTSGDCSTNIEIDCTSGYLVYRYVSRVMYNWIAQPVYQTRPVLQMLASTRIVIQSPSIGNIPNGTKFKIYGVRK